MFDQNAHDTYVLVLYATVYTFLYKTNSLSAFFSHWEWEVFINSEYNFLLKKLVS